MVIWAESWSWLTTGPGRGNGVTAQRYINQTLRLHIGPFVLVIRVTVARDNARPHSVRATVQILQQRNITIYIYIYI